MTDIQRSVTGELEDGWVLLAMQGARSAAICCPRCHQYLGLWSHVIELDGRVHSPPGEVAERGVPVLQVGRRQPAPRRMVVVVGS